MEKTNTEIQVFNYDQKQVRTKQIDGDPWFVLKDVCAILGIADHKVTARRLDEDEVCQTPLTDSLGREQETTVVNESGLYNVILRSDKPEAKPFRKWVTSDVLPSIRQHGAYMTPDVIERTLTDPDYIIQLATTLKQEQQKRRALEAKVEADAPAVRFADAITGSNTNILVRDLAKILKQNGVETGEKRLYETLRADGYLIKDGSDRNMPTQRSMELGLFFVKQSLRISKEGAVIDRVSKITPKGQKYFINRYTAKA